MAIEFDYSRAGRPVSWRACGFPRMRRGIAAACAVMKAAENGRIMRQSTRKHPAGAKARSLFSGVCGTLRQAQGRLEVAPCYKASTVSGFSAACFFALVAALPALAQYPGQINTSKQSGPDLRSVAVLEWTGDPGHPKASRLIPLTVWDGETLQDGAIYLAQPEPLSLEGEVEYKLKQDGKTVGLYDIEDAAQEEGSWVGYGDWKGLPVPKPPAPPKEFAQSDFGGGDDNGPPILHRRTPAQGSGGSGSSAPAQDPDRPTLHRASTDDDSANPNAPPPDPDRPILKEPAKAKPAKQKPQDDAGYSTPLAAISDPGRPRLLRGKPESSGPAVLPNLVGMPPDMHQTIAVSDATDHPDHLWNYTWANPEDADTMKSDLEEIARKDLGLIPPPPAPAPKHTTPHRKTKPAPPPPPPPPLLDEQFHVFQLTYGSGATMIFSAHTEGTGAQEKFITLIAQPDLYGNISVLLTNTTDAAHLDDTPRMRLVDPVDAMADNRGELLFELRGATERQFVLYRVLRGQIQKLYTSDELALVGPVTPVKADAAQN